MTPNFKPCGPSAGTGRALAVVASATPGQGVRSSNFDAYGKQIKKGCLVSWCGFRFRVLRIRLGVLVGRPVRFPVVLDLLEVNRENVVLMAHQVAVVS